MLKLLHNNYENKEVSFVFCAYIVDDDKYAAMATQMMFNWDALNISEVTKIFSANGLSEKILTEKPHVVFMDIEIGDISGLDIIRECKEKSSKTLFIIVSGHDNFDYAREAVNIGAIHYLLKPIDCSDVELVSEKLHKLLISEFKNLEIKNTLSAQPIDNDWTKIQKYIDNNYTKKLSVNNICYEMLIDRSKFYKLIKTNTGKTFIEYLTNIRLDKARVMLISSSKRIEDIAAEVGIPDVYYFNKVFKAHFGISPKIYRIAAQRGEQ